MTGAGLPTAALKRLLLVLMVHSGFCAAPAQTFGIGVKMGIRPGAGLAGYSGFTSESKRYAIGPMVTVGLPLGLAIETAALYRRFAFSARYFPILTSGVYSRWTADSWEFPILLRRGIVSGFYAGAGYAPRVLHGGESANGIVSLGPDLSHLVPTYFASSTRYDFRTTHGLTIAGGYEKRVVRLRFAPEVRYTYWNRPAFDNLGGGDYNPVLTTSQHQVDFMLGLSFGR